MTTLIDRSYENRDDDIILEMWDFLETLEDNQLSESQLFSIEDIINEVFKIRVRRNLSQQRKNRRKYRSKRSKVKMKARRYRRSAKGKTRAKRAKRMNKTGRTSTGRRQRKFVGARLGGQRLG